MRVILTVNSTDRGHTTLRKFGDCDCNCDCACPIGDSTLPVLPLPAAYYLELTPACNNACPACANRDSFGGYRAPVLRADQWAELIKRLATHAHHFKITGGEPTLHPDFEEIISTIDAQGIHFTLFSNGRWPAPKQLIMLLHRLPTFDGMLISLHGHRAEIHEAFSGVEGSFEETLTNIRLAADEGLDFSISMVINALNFNDIEDNLRLALEVGANHLVCNRLIGRHVPGLTPTEDQLRAAIRTIEALRRQGLPIRFGNCIPQCFAPSSSRGCTAGLTFATVDPWGRMRPCNHTSMIAGDLFHHSVYEIWHGKQMRKWRSLIPSACMSCGAYHICHGGCRAQALIEQQDKDPLMLGPFIIYEQAEPELRLYGELRPRAAFHHRIVESVETVSSRGQVAIVPEHLTTLVSKLDGSMTLRQIQEQYGSAALNWIGALYQEGMVTWA